MFSITKVRSQRILISYWARNSGKRGYSGCFSYEQYMLFVENLHLPGLLLYFRKHYTVLCICPSAAQSLWLTSWQLVNQRYGWARSLFVVLMCSCGCKGFCPADSLQRHNPSWVCLWLFAIFIPCHSGDGILIPADKGDTATPAESPPVLPDCLPRDGIWLRKI